jgi:hypothetical protein
MSAACRIAHATQPVSHLQNNIRLRPGSLARRSSQASGNARQLGTRCRAPLPGKAPRLTLVHQAAASSTSRELAERGVCEGPTQIVAGRPASSTSVAQGLRTLLRCAGMACVTLALVRYHIDARVGFAQCECVGCSACALCGCSARGVGVLYWVGPHWALHRSRWG